MDFRKINEKIICALDILITEDEYLLKNDISERSISHRLAQYLSTLFPRFNVDCEYNGNVEADSGKKYIFLLKKTAEKYGLLKRDEKENEVVTRHVYPDILIHKRGKSDHNILIIEIKKSSSDISIDYDIEKLIGYTSQENENSLNYTYGVLLIIGVKDKFNEIKIQWFSGGESITPLSLISLK